MPRQYRIFYRRNAGANFATLQPGAHAAIYDKPEVQAAIDHMRDNPHVEGMSLRLPDEQFNVIAFSQEAEAPNSFMFEPPAAGNDFIGRAADL